MLRKLITGSANYLIRCQVIKEEDRDIYEYGFHSLYNNIIDIGSITIISILLGQVMQTILYHLSFVILRQTAGGFHARTHLQCFVMSTGIWLLSLWGIKETSSQLLCIALAGICTVMIWLKSPIEHENSPMNLEKIRHMKSLSRSLSLFFGGIIIYLSMVLNKTHMWIIASLAFGMISQTLLLFLSLARMRKD